MHRPIIFFIILLLRTIPAEATGNDTQVYTNTIMDSRIRTVLLHKEGWNLSYPVIRLNSNEKLILHFDLLGDRIETFNYTFIHCSKDWEKSDIFTNDYLEGFPDNELEDFKPSFNTTVNYIHYTLSIPNERVKLTLSGNYILYVYPYDNPDKPVFTRRFIIAGDAVDISISAHRPQMSSEKDAGQQIDFTIDLRNSRVVDPMRNIYSFVLQNGRWDNAKKNLRPDFYGNNELKYSSLSENNIFRGGNEYRYFDIKSIRYKSEYIRNIDFVAPYYNVYLQASENREFKPYFYWQDFNGKYFIAAQEGRNPDTDADYVYVYFTLPSAYMLAGGGMYISGALNDWSNNENNLMIWNQEKGQYEGAMLLKQGWYNYEYLYLPDGEKNGVATKYEGSHYETENDYMAIVYYRSPRDRYDRIIGTGSVNTLNKISY